MTKEKERCQNCAHKETCIMRGVTIFNLFIVTGRTAGLPEAMEKLNIRPSCQNWEGQPDEI